MRCVDILVLGGTGLHRPGFRVDSGAGLRPFTPRQCPGTGRVSFRCPLCSNDSSGMISACFAIGFLIKDWKRQLPVRFRFRHELIVVWGCGGASEVCVACILCVVGRRSVGTSGNSVEERDRKGENGSVGKIVEERDRKGRERQRIGALHYTW